MNTWKIKADSTETSTQMIVWWTSQTWSMQKDILDENIDSISTGRASVDYTSLGQRANIPVWLWLKDKQQIQEGVRDLHETGEVFSWKALDLTLHAMSMRLMSETYPQELVSALEDIKAQVNSVIYISYEDGHSPENPQGSHVFYPVRSIKQNMEASALKSLENAKIVDLITFDSPSAKVLGFTFLGIVGDFINFLESHQDSNHFIVSIFRPILKKFLGKDYDEIIELFQQYPIRWQLWEWQQSMKQMALDGELNAMISSSAKKINFAKFSRISWVITELYLTLAMNDLNENRKEILSSQWDRVLLDWNRISDQPYSWWEKLLSIQSKLEELTGTQSVEGFRKNTLYIEVTWGKNYKKYEFDISQLDFLSHHMGILPLFIEKEMLYNSWYIWNDEYIKTLKPKSKVYTYNTITIKREGDKILLVNTDNNREVFCECTVSQKSDMKTPQDIEDEDEIFPIPKSENDKEIDESSFPHSVSWGTTFVQKIPHIFEGVGFSRRSALTEHIGFRSANLLLNNPNEEYISELKRIFPRVSKFDPKKIQGVFAWEEIIYERNNIEKLLSELQTPEIEIVWMQFGGNKLFVTTQLLDNDGSIIGKYKHIYD